MTKIRKGQISSGVATLGQALTADGASGADWTTIAATSGELLMQDGVTAPPVPTETEDQSDWLYQG
jgi:hypothetical protein